MSDNPWASIRIMFGADGPNIDYADNLGNKFDDPLSQDGIADFRSKIAPRIKYLLDVAKSAPARARQLPIFIAPPARASRLPWLRTSSGLPRALGLEPKEIGGETWEDVFANLLKGDIRDDDLQVVRLLADAGSGQAPFTLPLRILSIGRASQFVKEAVESQAWLKDVEAEDAGLTVSDSWFRELVFRRAANRETDILVCDERDLPRVAAALRLSGHSPRLVVALTRTAPHTADAALPNLPPGTSLLMLPAGGDLGRESDALVELLSDFARDLPLHEFGHTEDQPRRGRTLLASNPAVLDALRLSDAIAGVVAEADDLKGSMTFSSADDLIGTLGDAAQPPSNLVSALRSGRSPVIVTGADNKPMLQIDRDRFGSADFLRSLPKINSLTRSGDGFLPLSEFRRGIVRERTIEQQRRTAVTEAVANPQLRDMILTRQARVVDVQVYRLDSEKGAVKSMDKKQTLALHSTYRIAVKIGDRSAASVITGGDPPSIDGLLPPPERGRRHILTVVFYSDNLAPQRAQMQRIELPEIGASNAAEFDIVPRSLGAAQGRIAVYYDVPPDRNEGDDNNHLIQSFLFHAQVAEGENDAKPGEYGIEVVLEFSLTKRFAELKTLKPRLMSLILNDGPGVARHRLMMKRGAEAGAVDFTEAELDASIRDIRARLESATHTRRQARFPSDKPADEAEFDAVIWDLAKSGQKLHDALFTAADPPLRRSISKSVELHDEVVQAVYLGNYPFPWALLYDFPLPKDIYKGPTPPVCRGFDRKKDGKPYSCGDCLRECLHPGQDKEKIVCVYGFWGFRHQVEQIKQDNTERDKPGELKPVGDGAVRFMVGLDGGYAAEIPDNMKAQLGPKAKQIGDQEGVLDLLWSAGDRPAILLLVGHYETEDEPGQIAGPRLTLSNGRFLQPSDVVQKHKKHPSSWDDPHSVILLAACSGAVVELKSGVNFVSSFTNAGAGAVVGPEVSVYESLAGRFGVEMSAKIVGGASVGAAMLDFRRSLLRQFNPLGLVFTAYGSADLAPPSAAGAAIAATNAAISTTAVLP